RRLRSHGHRSRDHPGGIHRLLLPGARNARNLTARDVWRLRERVSRIAEILCVKSTAGDWNLMTDNGSPLGAVPATKVPRYAGKGTFARIVEADEVGDYDIAVLGVPFDGGTSYRPGARFGPMAVRQAARTLRPGHHVELGVSPLSTVQIVDAGDVTVTPYDIAEACTQIQHQVREVIGDRARRF